MIRKRLHRRWLARHESEGAAILASFWSLAHWHWIDRYCDWDVNRYGELPGSDPWWLRPVSRFVCWCADWRTTFSLRFGKHR